MAENTETRIVKIEIDQTQALKDLEQTESAIIDLKTQQKELNDQLKAGTITQQEYVAGKVQLDQKLKQETDSRKTLTQTINTESNSLDAQRLKLKDLVAQRDKIDRSTVEGAKKFDEMNKSINTLSGSIKTAEQQGGSFQRNVGNYKGTIDQFTGGAYSAAAGLMGMVKASLAFIATPIGAIIAAIGVALASLMAYFKGSEEGQNKLNAIMAVAGQIMERITDVVENLGSAVYDAFTNPKQALLDLYNFLKDNLINRFTAFAVIVEGITELDFKKVANGVIQAGTGIENVVDKVIEVGKEAGKTIDKAVTDGQRLAAMQAKLDKDERKFLEDSSKRKLEISELRRKADEADGQNKLDFLNAALELEKVNADQQLANAQQRRDIAAEEVTLNGDTKEALDKQAKAEADLFSAKAAYFDETRKMNKERIATEKVVDDTVLKRIDDDQKLSQQETDRVAKAEVKSEEEVRNSLENIEKKTKATEDANKDLLESLFSTIKIEEEVSDQEVVDYAKREIKKREELEKTYKYTVDLAGRASQDLSGIFAGITAAKNLESKNQLDRYQIDQNKELDVLKAHLDSGLITEEVYKQRVDQVNKEYAKKQDDVKRQAFEDNKKNQIAQARIDQAQIILGAIKSVAGVPLVGAILAAAAAAAQLIITERQIDAIKASQYVPGSFSIGGYTGAGGVNDPAGLVHKGEVVWNQRDVAAVGGPMMANAMRPTFMGYADGGIVASGITNAIDSQFMSATGMPTAYLSLGELNTAQKNLAMKVQIVEA